MRRPAAAIVVAAAAVLVAAAPAAAHGLAGRSDLPIPDIFFAWAAAAVLVITFVALGVGWQTPVLEHRRARPVLRVPRAVEVVCGGIGVLVLVGLIYAGLVGNQTPTSNVTPTTVYVLFWVGIPVVSVLLGDVFRPFNPWRAIGRASGWALKRVMHEPPPPLRYPERFGRWPAVAGLVTFGWLELVPAEGSKPSVLAIAAMAYVGAQFVGMSLYGVETWSRRGDTFGIYFSIFGRLSPFTTEGGNLALRRPLSGLTDIDWLPGTVFLLCAAIGITAFDGASEGPAWNSITDDLQQAFVSLGFSLGTALQIAFTIGLLLAIVVVTAFYGTGIEGVHREAPERSARELARRFGHSLAPIAFAYILAHYFSLFVYQGQATVYLISDPLGDGSDLFGTANVGIDYGLVSAVAIRWVQTITLVTGHVAALIVAHDRALVDFGHTQKAVRSQYWMLGVMVGFTMFGLWLLSESNG